MGNWLPTQLLYSIKEFFEAGAHQQKLNNNAFMKTNLAKTFIFLILLVLAGWIGLHWGAPPGSAPAFTPATKKHDPAMSSVPTSSVKSPPHTSYPATSSPPTNGESAASKKAQMRKQLADTNERLRFLRDKHETGGTEAAMKAAAERQSSELSSYLRTLRLPEKTIAQVSELITRNDQYLREHRNELTANNAALIKTWAQDFDSQMTSLVGPETRDQIQMFRLSATERSSVTGFSGYLQTQGATALSQEQQAMLVNVLYNERKDRRGFGLLLPMTPDTEKYEYINAVQSQMAPYLEPGQQKYLGDYLTGKVQMAASIGRRLTKSGK